jgi:AcrR family transcriptional regulator
MTRIAKAAERPYRSQLRADQTDATRARILDATVRVMARGIATLSMPAVAREAGVSVPTVYRHFATKPDLIAAIYPHVLRRASLGRPDPPRSLDELRGSLRAYFDHVESFDVVARAAQASPVADEMRRLTMPDRLAIFRRLTDSIQPPASDVVRDRIARLLVVLTQSSALRLWRDQFGTSIDEAADDIDWLVRAVFAEAARGTEP